MAADLYWDWLKVPRDRRPANHFDLLGLPVECDDLLAIEEAAKRQVQRVKDNLDGPHAADGARLLQEIALARSTLIDSTKRARYRQSLTAAPSASPPAAPPAGSGVQPWWQEVAPKGQPAAPKPAVPATQPVQAVRPVPRATPVPQQPASQSGEFTSMDTRRRRRGNDSSMLPYILAGGGLLLAVVVIVVVVIVMSSGSKPTEQANNNTQRTEPVATRSTAPRPTNPNGENPGIIKSPFLAERETALTAAEIQKPTAIQKYERHTGLVQGVALSPVGRRFVSAGEGGAFEWDRLRGQSFLRHAFRVPALTAAYLPGTQLMIAADEGSVLALDLSTNQVKATLKHPRGLLQAVAASRKSAFVATGGTDGTLRWWNVNKAEPDRSIELGENIAIISVAVSGDDKWVAAGCNDGTIGVWDIATGMPAWRQKHHAGAVTALAFSPDGMRLASAGADKAVAVWESTGGKGVAKFAGHEPVALCVAFLEKSPGLVSGGRDNQLRFWNLESGQPLRALPMPGAVHCIAVGAGDSFLMVGGSGGLLQALPMPELDFEAIVKESPPTQKLAVPDSAEADAALAGLRQKYKLEIENGKPEDVLAVAERLRARAGGKAGDVLRFAQFRLARDLFAQLGKLESTFATIDELDRWFEIDDLADKANAASALSQSTQPAGQKAIIESAIKLMDRADRESRPDVAGQIMPLLEKAAEKSAVPDLVKYVTAVRKHREQEAANTAKIAELEGKLKANAADKEAHLALGLLLCGRHNWKDGLTHLSKGSNAAAADAASSDLDEPKLPKVQLELAQTWVNLAEKSADGKLAFYQRAKHWIEKAEPALLPDDKSRATLLLGQVSARISTLTPNKDLPMEGLTTKPAGPKSGEAVIRRNFNSLRNEATFKSQWKPDGNTRWENQGLRMLESPVAMTSTFTLADKWRVEIVVEPDGREVVVEVNGQTISQHPTRNPSVFILERNGKKLSYVLTGRGSSGTPSSISLADDAAKPSKMTIKLQGTTLPNRTNGMQFLGVVITGPVHLEE